MCGIWGFWDKLGNQSFTFEEVESYTKVMSNRGPDDFGFYKSEITKHMTLGFRRLAIIDLEGGQQPMTNENGTIFVILNGEIYNYKALRESLIRKGHRFKTLSDTEVIVHGYEEWGEKVFKYLCGMFGIAIWDENECNLIIARDRLGIKPVYYINTTNAFGFSSDPRALLQFSQFNQGLDQEALTLYLFYGYVPAPWSIYKGIKKLRPGHICVIKKNSIKKSRYWNLRFVSHEVNKVDRVEEFYHLFQNIVKEHLVSDVPLGAFLSGGLDSTSVAYAATCNLKKPLETFHVAFQDSNANESVYAKQVATLLKTNHQELYFGENPTNKIEEIISNFPEPIGDSAVMPVYLLCQMMKDKCTVVLSGDGGDEVFSGYSLRRLQTITLFNKFSKQISEYFYPRLHKKESYPFSLLDISFYYAMNRASLVPSQVSFLLGAGNEKLQPIKEHINMMRADLDNAEVEGAINPYLYLDQSFGLSDQMLAKVDTASMANSIEVRVPFLDHRLVEFAAKLPESFKQRGFGRNRTKKIVREFLMKKFPAEFIQRPKKGFGIPMNELIVKNIKKDFYKNKFKLNNDLIHTKNIIDSFENNNLSSKGLWSIYAFSIWYKKVGEKYL